MSMSQWHRKRNVVVSDALAYWKIQFAIERERSSNVDISMAHRHTCAST
jgi:hypothetical protein